MYIPAEFRVANIADLHDHIRKYSFATLITTGKKGITATHLPVLLDADSGQYGQLLGHMARANPQWKAVDGEALVIFPGPHAYVSASWYDTAGTVPTWNYITVHAYGTIRLIEENDALHDILMRTIWEYEQSMPQPWTYDQSNPLFDNMLRQIIGFQIDISRLEGKYKLNQNHPSERRQKVIRALQENPDADSHTIARLMAAMLTE